MVVIEEHVVRRSLPVRYQASTLQESEVDYRVDINPKKVATHRSRRAGFVALRNF